MKSLLLLFLLAIAGTANVQAQSTDKIAFGGRFICALDEIGGIDCVTGDGFTRLQPPSNAPALTAISTGDVHACGITQAGAAFCWGDNNFGQLDAPQDVQFISMSSGTNLSCGVTINNSVECWGLDTHGETQPPADKLYTQTAHDENTSCGLQLDGKISCWGQFPDRADRLAQYTFTDLDVDSYVEALCGVTDQSDVRCTFSNWDFEDDLIDVALSNNLYCGLRATGDISCRTNYSYSPWQNHVTARVAEINSGANVVALYGDSNGDGVRASRVCYELDTGEFGCIVREIFSAPRLPGGGTNEPEPAQTLNAYVYSDTTVELVWVAVTPNEISGADIYRDNELIATTQNGTSYIDDTLVSGVQYEYTIELINLNGVRSVLSAPVSVTTGQRSSNYRPVDRPSEPTGLTVLSYSQNEIELFWDRAATLPSNFNGYEIRRNHEFFAFTRGISFYDSNVQPNTVYHYDVIAVSRDGDILGFSGIDVNTGE